MKKKQINALIKLSKQSEKECEIKHPNMAGAYYDEKNDRTYISNTYWAIWFDGLVDGLTMKDTKGTYPRLETLIGEKCEYVPVDIDCEEVKEKSKTYKKEDFKNKDKLVRLGDTYFNPKYVLSLISCFTVYQSYVNNKWGLLLLESDGITAIICGIREVK